MEIDTNLFGDATSEETISVLFGVVDDIREKEKDQEEIEKAKKEIADSTALLQSRPDIPDAQEVGNTRAIAARVMKLAQELVVKDEASYTKGCDLAKACTTAINAVEKPAKTSKMAKVQEQKENAHSLHKFFTGLISSLVDPYKDARKIIDGKTTKWHREEVERRRVEAEKKRLAEEKARAEEKLRLAVNIESIGTADAKRAAEAILEEPIYVEPVAVEAPHVEGSTHVPRWTFEVTDVMALIKAVAAGTENASLLAVNTTMLGQMARSQKNAAKVTGVRFYDAGTVRHA